MGFESPVSVQKPEESPRFLEGDAVRANMIRYLDALSQKIDANISKDTDLESFRGRRFDQITVDHGNLEIEMMGIAHITESLPRCRGKIEAAIKDSDFLILENIVEAKDSNLARGGGVAVSSDGMFFLEVERMVRKYGKGLVTTDPYYGDGTQEKEHKDSMEGRERLVKDARVLAGVTGAIASVGGGGLVAASVLEKLSKNNMPVGESRVSRRDFLKFSAAGAGALLSHKVAGGVSAEDKNYGNPNTGDPSFDYQLNDYRDVVIAEGIDMMSRSFTRKRKVSLLFGAHHLKGIRYYLDHPDIRRAKMALYEPFQQVADPKLRAYHFELDKKVSEKDAQKGNFGEWRKDVEIIIKAPQ